MQDEKGHSRGGIMFQKIIKQQYMHSNIPPFLFIQMITPGPNASNLSLGGEGGFQAPQEHIYSMLFGKNRKEDIFVHLKLV